MGAGVSQPLQLVIKPNQGKQTNNGAGVSAVRVLAACTPIVALPGTSTTPFAITGVVIARFKTTANAKAKNSFFIFHPFPLFLSWSILGNRAAWVNLLDASRIAACQAPLHQLKLTGIASTS